MVARNRMVISGYLGSPQVERWSCSVNYTLAGGGAVLSPVELQSWATRAATYLGGAESALNEITLIMSTVAGADRIDLYAYDDDGPAIATANASLAFSGGGTLRAPFDTAVAVSLLTDRAGRSYRGRFFWPGLGVLVSTNGKWAVDTDLPAQFAAMLLELGNIDGTTTAQLGVYSPSQDVVTPVTSIRIGDVTDNQRRRRDNIVESYSSDPYPA